MFRIHFTNFGYSHERSFTSVSDALAFGKKCHFEFTVRDEHGVVLAWSPLYGTVEYRALGADGELRADSPR